MTIQAPWRSARRTRTEQPAEILEARGTHWPVLLLVVVALLLGLGLGHTVFGADADRLRETGRRLDAVSEQVRVLQQSVRDLGAREATMSQRVAESDQQSTGLVVTLGSLLRAGHGATVSRPEPAGPRVVHLVDAVTSDVPLRQGASPSYATDAVLHNFLDGREVRGAADIARYRAEPHGFRMTRTGPVRRIGSYAAAPVSAFVPFDDAMAHLRAWGVRRPATLLVRIDHGRVTREWLARSPTS